MSKPKEMIPVANLVLLVEALQAYRREDSWSDAMHSDQEG